MFEIGQRVVCINDAGQLGGALGFVPESGVIKGSVYTIESFWAGGAAVGLEELPGNRAWWRWRFRPVKRTDISVFTALLNPSPADLLEYLEEVTKQ